jgi:hypothetical protein
MIKKFTIGVFLVLISSLGLTYFTPMPSVSAVSCTTNDTFLTFPQWNRGLECDGIDEKTHVVIGDGEGDIPKFVWTIALNALDILLRVAGIMAVIMLIVSGYQYLTSAGTPDKISKAKTGMLRAIVGLALALLASAIIYFIVGWIMTP